MGNAREISPGIHISDDGLTLTIDGTNFARTVFAHLARDEIGTVLRIRGRSDGTVICETVDLPTIESQAREIKRLEAAIATWRNHSYEVGRLLEAARNGGGTIKKKGD